MDTSAIESLRTIHGHDRKILVDGRSIAMRDAGDPKGAPVIFFHGTPGSRLDVCYGEEGAKAIGIRVVTFDRPGYGQSDATPFGFRSIARDTAAIADDLGLDRFATMGISGGGPFALATASFLRQRVTSVGVVAGPGPFVEVPGAIESQSENDRLAASFLPADPGRAARQFIVGTEPLVALRDDDKALRSWIDATLGSAEAAALPPAVRDSVFFGTKESLRQGLTAAGWDNAAYFGHWDFSLKDVRCPVHLWYGDRDPLVPVIHGEWLRDHLPNAVLEVIGGAGHVGMMVHWKEMLKALTTRRG